MKSLKNMTGDSLEQMIDYKVIDQNGDEIGTLHSLWSDPTTGSVEFLGVKTGWIFGHNHVVPAEKAELDESSEAVRLPYTSLFIKEAPSMSADAEISEAEEENIYRYYGMTVASADSLPVTGTASAMQSEIPEAIGASSLASASAPGDGTSQIAAPGSAAGDAASRWKRVIRDAGSSPAVTAGGAVRSALDDLTPGDSSSTSTTPLTAASPGSYGTTNMYGSTGTTTPVAADSLGPVSSDPAADAKP